MVAKAPGKLRFMLTAVLTAIWMAESGAVGMSLRVQIAPKVGSTKSGAKAKQVEKLSLHGSHIRQFKKAIRWSGFGVEMRGGRSSVENSAKWFTGPTRSSKELPRLDAMRSQAETSDHKS